MSCSLLIINGHVLSIVAIRYPIIRHSAMHIIVLNYKFNQIANLLYDIFNEY